MASLPSFDDLMQLAKDDPKQLTILRQQLCQEFIASCPASNQTQLQAQQHRLNLLIARSQHPLHTNALLRQELLRLLQRLTLAIDSPEQLSQHSAKLHHITEGRRVKKIK
ncbi:DUF3135 domain-containing protein [Photobacterium damselae subsp. piscicida]|uniref:DUF3135 domain-containing protein n=1 Tax=Photobacterium damsela subsp. piscicida TaxID=38294 RepID=L7NJK4_PHODP|nr:DUF3135 domain-containing protein [Photobacterium damselae]AEU09901.1 hypothetical protein PDP_0111 [Photobacterium damselae subsp. piscicida]MBE8128123.1 DUF3135 domain-containing protein [Photobacterium damselae subsp. piscicida]MDP2515815.1 DUF3135 domain-containing protein [Photobacterium damselae subsp. piscicida]MDP2533561.1 DUF3135 domain-containing protein [Photobacterium damselae subsp. piscicida]OLQ81943.1 hypothetical protein BEI67_00750 [Photobacterium damselae subsp. piscicida]